MISPAMDRGGLKDSENAPNSFFPKINRTVFWQLGTDMLLGCGIWPKDLEQKVYNHVDNYVITANTI